MLFNLSNKATSNGHKQYTLKIVTPIDKKVSLYFTFPTVIGIITKTSAYRDVVQLVDEQLFLWFVTMGKRFS